MISDIGEGKVLRPEAEKADPTRHRASYGVIDFRAPEIRSGEGWSIAADVFSFGVIACRMMECRRIACTLPPPEQVLAEVEKSCPDFKRDDERIAYIVPKLLKKTITHCFERKPEDRPKMRQVVYRLDDCTMEFLGKKVQWTFWNWEKTLAEAFTGTHQSLARSWQHVDGEF